MIRYRLCCAQNHQFDSWFANSDAFDTLNKAGQVACPHCGDTDISKSLMAPPVAGAARPLTEAPTPAETALAELRANSEHVGTRFAAEARAMHDGEIPKRQIHGEAKLEDAKALIEDGVPILPLPMIPKSKVN